MYTAQKILKKHNMLGFETSTWSRDSWIRGGNVHSSGAAHGTEQALEEAI
jgi:hypothetical protein